MEKSGLKKCKSCGKQVPKNTLDKSGECAWCKEDKQFKKKYGKIYSLI